jgi:hypothetical protein
VRGPKPALYSDFDGEVVLGAAGVELLVGVAVSDGVLVDSDDLAGDSASLEEDGGLVRPLDEPDDDERESVIYQPLPLNTMPTG